MINTGFFALKALSPSWNAWATLTRHYYKKTDLFFIEQMALNYLIYNAQVPNPYFLPAHCNYIPMLALPLLDKNTGLFYEAPGPPLQKIWAMHVTGSLKDHYFEVATLQGGRVRTSLLNPEVSPGAVQKDN